MNLDEFRRRTGLYNRQTELDLRIPEAVTVVGLGGIGSWVALNLGLVGVNRLFLIDYDVIEVSNLNRTPFRDIDIETTKTEAVTDLILERRDNIEIRSFTKNIDDLTTLELKELENTLIIDCRDIIDELPEELDGNNVIKLGYDGLSCTVILNPIYKNVFETEENRGYEVIPSFVAPCTFLATAITTLITDPSFNIDEHKNDYKQLNLNEHVLNLFKGV